jgi:hypothetical protein
MTDNSNQNFSAANCSVGTRDIDALIRCQDLNCSVDSIRKSDTPTFDDSSWHDWVLIENLWNALPFSAIGYWSHAVSSSKEQSSMTEDWIFNPQRNFTDGFNFVNLSTLDSPTLSSRLQVVYNTFFQTTYSTRYLIGNLSTDLSYYDNATMDADGTDGSTISFNSSKASISQSNGEVYFFHWLYGTLLILISALLLVAGLSSLIMKQITLAPDILGYASTGTRDNRFIDVVNEGNLPSYQDGLERARELRDVRVMIGDIQPDSNVGYIAFTKMNNSSHRLMKGRKYG